MSAEYKELTLQVSNAMTGQRISVGLGANGVNIAFSIGPEFQRNSRLNIRSISGELPISNFQVTPNTILISTSSSIGNGGGLTFEISLFLTAESNVSTFYLNSNSDQGVEITAAVGQSIPQVINQSQTLFKW